MQFAILVLCCVAGWGLAQPMLRALRAHNAARSASKARSMARALRHLRNAKAR